MRSVRKVLHDTAALFEELKIKRRDVFTVTVYNYDDIVGVHVRPEVFVRVFRAARVPRAKLETSIQNEYAHASFLWRRVDWATCQRVDPEVWEAMLRRQAVDALPEARPQIGTQQLLLAGPT